MSFGKGSNTTTNTNTPNPQAMAGYQDVLARAQGVANTPFSTYGGEFVAPVNQQQQAGISGINQNAGFASPYFDEAHGYATQAAQPLSAADIQRYQSPYTQQVVDATQRQFANMNAQQMQGVKGNAIAQGALGGDREKVGEAILAGQQQSAQAPVIAGLYNQGYSQALQTAQQQQQNLGNAAQSIGSLGVAGQSAGLQGAGAQIGAGTLQQQTQQAQDQALYQQFLAQQAYPFQTAQWLAGINTGVGSQMGGTSTTTGPTPNPLNQMLGLGLTAAGAYFGGPAGAQAGSAAGQALTSARGGRIPGFADGGAPVMPYASGVGYVPMMQLTAGNTMPRPPGAGQGQSGGPSQQSMSQAGAGLGRMLAGSGNSPLSLNSVSFAPGRLGDINPAGFGTGMGFGDGPIYYRGGGVRGYDDGGPVMQAGFGTGSMVPSFDDRFSGELSYPPVEMPFADRAEPAQEGIASGAMDPQMGNATAYGPPAVSDAGLVPLPRSRPSMIDDVGMPPEASPTAGFGDPISLAPPAPEGDGMASPSNAPPSRGGFASGISPAAWQGLMSAGLGMMASRSPHLGVAIGEGGQQGLATYMGQKKAERDDRRTEAQMQHQRLHTDLAVKRLAQDADRAAKELALRSRMADETTRQHDILDRNRKGALEERRERSGYMRNPDGSLSPIKGGPADPVQIAAVNKAKQTGGLLPDDTADFLAERILAGDAKALTNLGRGAQGAENIIKVQTLASRKATERGMNPSDILAKVAEQSGLTAQQRTFGTQVARMAVNSTEAEGAIHQGLEVSKNVPRSKFVPVNKLVQMVESNISDPDLLEFRAANLAIINTYARAISPTGTPTVHDKEEAMKVVSEATSPEAYERVMRRMLKEIEIAHAAPLKAKQEMERIRRSGAADSHGATAPLSSAAVKPEDKAALDWANANPGDPRSAAIKKRLGVE